MAFTLDLRKKKEVSKSEPAKPEPPPVPAAEPRPGQAAQAIAWEFDRNPPSRRKAPWICSILVATAISIFYFSGDYLFAILLCLCGIVILASSFRRPYRVSVKLDKVSITIDDQRYSFGKLKSFWINYNPPREKELVLVTQRPLAPVIRVPLENANPLEIRGNMVSLIPEKEYEDSLVDYVVRKLEK